MYINLINQSQYHVGKQPVFEMLYLKDKTFLNMAFPPL